LNQEAMKQVMARKREIQWARYGGGSRTPH
jgi:hypothetical protein